MIESILEEYSNATFDFREFANPGDPLSALFPEWVSYYRMKYAIAKALQPRSIFEIGVRFGYSATAFLSGAPNASYVGIDLDSDRFGGNVGALQWARQITRGYRAEFIEADSQKFERWPGGIYDLVHVDGQQDGLGTFHDLRRSVAQGRWVLMDGYFWTQENFINANDFLLKYKDAIRYALTIPGYAGELLIRTRDEYVESTQSSNGGAAVESTQLTNFYTSDYYLKDCGGYAEFKKFGAQGLRDPRLLSLLSLVRLSPGKRALDLGCGRGEVTYQLAANGCEVTAIDYSRDAIAIARSCFDAAPAPVRDRVTFICDDVRVIANSTETFDVAVAGDIIEHLAPGELAGLYRTISQRLSPAGVFVIHTYPNVWRYKRNHSQRAKAIASLGGFLPAEPRTRYELLMHINEQSPARLRRALQKEFRFVHVWVSKSTEEPAGGLAKQLSFSELTSAPDVYALASNAPLDLARAAALLTTEPLPANAPSQFSVEVTSWPRAVTAGSNFSIPALISNRSPYHVSSMPPWPTYMSYHWYTRDRETLVHDGVRTPIPFGIDPGEEMSVNIAITAPEHRDVLLLRISPVQEGCRWFDQGVEFKGPEALIDVR